MARKPRRTSTELKALKKQINELAVLGYSGTRIAEDLGMPERTCNTYLKDHREKRAREQTGHADEIIGELIEAQERRVRYLQGIISKGTKAEKMKAVALLQQEDQMKIKRNQLAGNLPTEAPVIAIQNTNVMEGTTTIADSIRRLHPELADRFTKNKAKTLEMREEDTGIQKDSNLRGAQQKQDTKKPE